MKSEREISERLTEIEFRLRQMRAMGDGSSHEARSLEGQQKALQWVLQG